MMTVACGTMHDSRDEDQHYQSVWHELYPSSLKAITQPQSMQDHFYQAAASRSRQAAEIKWSIFLQKWQPKNEEYEDAMHVRLVSWAKKEKQRLDYLLLNQLARARMVELELKNIAAEY